MDLPRDCTSNDIQMGRGVLVSEPLTGHEIPGEDIGDLVYICQKFILRQIL